MSTCSSRIFLNAENFKQLIPSLHEIFSIAPEKASINTYQTSKTTKSYLRFGKMQFDGKNDSAWISQHVSEAGWMHLHTTGREFRSDIFLMVMVSELPDDNSFKA